MSKIIFNNKILNKENFKISFENRAFCYGDGLFESIKIINKKPFNLAAHINRLFSSALLLNLEINFNERDIQNNIQLLLKENELKESGIVKILLFREWGGKYLPENNKTSFLIICEESQENLFVLNKKGLTLGLFLKQFKSLGEFSNFKTMSALQSVICSIEAKKIKKDDCLVFNSKNRVIESANSNVFYVKNNIIYTPRLKEGCVAGTMRNFILNLNNLAFQIKEVKVTLEQILIADEVFLTNAIQGIRWVSKIEKRSFDQQNVSKFLINKINQLV